jgi:hypothetical protein
MVTTAKRRLGGPLLGSRAPEVDNERPRCRLEHRVALSMLGSAELTNKHDFVLVRNIAEPFDDSGIEPDSEKMCWRAEAPEEVRKGRDEDVVRAKPTWLRYLGCDLTCEYTRAAA